MSIAIVLAPDLDISATELIEAWNASASTSALASASLPDTKSSPVAFPLDPQLQQTLIFLGGVAGGIVIDVIKTTLTELISELRQRKRQQRPPTLRVETVPQPGGAVLLVVHEEK